MGEFILLSNSGKKITYNGSVNSNVVSPDDFALLACLCAVRFPSSPWEEGKIIASLRMAVGL
jgi:hypothetical protein